MQRFRDTVEIPQIAIGDLALRQTCVRVTLTAAQICGMFATPVQIVPPGDSGDVLIVHSAVLKMAPGSVAFTGGGAVSLQYHAAPNNAACSGTIPASTVTAAANSPTTYSLLQGASGASSLTLPTNSGIDITNSGGAFASGNGTAHLYIVYSKLQTTKI